MRKKPKSSPSRLPLHLLLAACAMVVVAIAVGLGPSVAVPATVITPRLDIGVEHTSPLTLFIRGTEGKTPGLIEFSHDGTETAPLSIPDTWILREVRRAAIKDITVDPPIAGFRRWHLPATVVLSFQTPGSVSLTVHNPSDIPLLIRHTRVSFPQSEATEGSVLAAEKPVRVW
jgi:hypothetical protein